MDYYKHLTPEEIARMQKELEDPLLSIAAMNDILLQNVDYLGARKKTAAEIHQKTGDLGERIIKWIDTIHSPEIQQREQYVLLKEQGQNPRESDLTNYIGVSSHALRTPFTPLSGFSQILRDRDLPTESAREFAEDMAGSTAKLERVVGKLVDFYKTEAGMVVYEPKDVSLSEAVNVAVNSLKGRFPKHEFNYVPGSNLKPVYADPDTVKKVLYEVIENAARFSEDSKVLITAHGARNKVPFYVFDRGIGLSPDQVQDVFNPFYHAPTNSGGESEDGLGLGLSTAKLMLEQQGGSIRIESGGLGKGTMVYFELPTGKMPKGT
jgi:signal transduction histidine kinase